MGLYNTSKNILVGDIFCHMTGGSSSRQANFCWQTRRTICSIWFAFLINFAVHSGTAVCMHFCWKICYFTFNSPQPEHTRQKVTPYKQRRNSMSLCAVLVGRFNFPYKKCSEVNNYKEARFHLSIIRERKFWAKFFPQIQRLLPTNCTPWDIKCCPLAFASLQSEHGSLLIQLLFLLELE